MRLATRLVSRRPLQRRFRVAGTCRIRYRPGMLGTNLKTSEQLLAGAAMALTFAVFFVIGLQLGGHW